MTYVFNEAQEAWLTMLESGEYAQGRNCLRAGDSFCCLGVACVAGGIAAVKEDSAYTFAGRWMYAPKAIVSLLKLRSDGGEFSKQMKIGSHTCGSLIDANDRGATFSEIAAFIRSNPTAVFKE